MLVLLLKKDFVNIEYLQTTHCILFFYAIYSFIQDQF